LTIAIGTALTATLALGPTGSHAAATEEYAALGDSYASGTGARNPDLDPTCVRSSDAYGPEIATERAATSLVFPACAGAETPDVVKSQVSSLSAATDWVTVSIGGNDVGFIELILSCGTELDEPMCLQKVEEVNGKIDQELGPKLDAAYDAIKTNAPNARVISIGYPRPFGDNLDCLDADGITPNEATALNGLVDNLEAKIAERSSAAGIGHINPIKQFTGHDICARTAFLNGKMEPTLVDAYHPSPEGYSDGFKPLIRSIMG
jgi:lysophospholipase L1-like esterase